MTASVVSGVISDTEPTNVVLPTPNPPATTIFTDVMVCDASATGRATLDLTESTKHPFEQMKIGTAFRVFALVNSDQAIRAHVRDEDSCHPEREPQHRRHLGDRPPVPAELQDRLAFRCQYRQVSWLKDCRGDQRLDRQLEPGLGPASGDGVRPDKPGRPVLLRAEPTPEARANAPVVPSAGPYSCALPGAGRAGERRSVVTAS